MFGAKLDAAGVWGPFGRGIRWGCLRCVFDGAVVLFAVSNSDALVTCTWLVDACDGWLYFEQRNYVREQRTRRYCCRSESGK